LCKKLFLFLFVLFFSLAVQAQEYRITEAELTQLEAISKNWEKSKQTLLSQIQSLKAKLQQAESLSKTLNEQLQTERATLSSLRQSYSAYEREVAQLKEALSAEKLQHRKTREQRNKLLFILIGGSVLVIGFIVLKFIVRLKLF